MNCLKPIVKFARQLGLIVEIGNENEYYPRTQFRTASIHIHLLMSDLLNVKTLEAGARGLAHELGHYLLAPPSRRSKKDYGIPPRQRASQNRKVWNLDESRAILIEGEILKHAGLKSQNAWRGHDALDWWFNGAQEDCQKLLRKSRRLPNTFAVLEGFIK